MSLGPNVISLVRANESRNLPLQLFCRAPSPQPPAQKRARSACWPAAPGGISVSGGSTLHLAAYGAIPFFLIALQERSRRVAAGKGLHSHYSGKLSGSHGVDHAPTGERFYLPGRITHKH